LQEHTKLGRIDNTSHRMCNPQSPEVNRSNDMAEPEPITELGAFSSPSSTPSEWSLGRAALTNAEVYWLSTVRPDGRPHVTPLRGVWLVGAMYFCTGPDERKAKNLAENRHCPHDGP
jgi:hypothetical protein